MRLPTLAEYQDAIQNPNSCFVATELKTSLPDYDKLGMPKAFSGNFAVVFPLVNSGKKWAVRCFATYHSDQELRYRNLSRFLKAKRMQCMVDFEFIPQGIRVKGNWLPILKMEWIEGVPLNKYIEDNLNHPDSLIDLANKFYTMVTELGRHGVAHGDLQHGNILVVNGQLRLVDYDCMFVPGLEGLKSNEIGHKNYQHPKRSANDFGPSLDNFSAWCIYLSLFALAIDPSLWKLLDAGDENLLFKKNDMEAPAGSAAFKMLESISDENVRLLTAAFRKTLGVQDISLVPPLTIGKLKQGKIKWIPDTLTPKPQLEAPNWTDWVPGFLPQQKPIESLKPSFSEHVLYKLLILLGFYLSYSLFTKNGIDISAAYAFSAGMPSALILSVIRFLKLPEKVNKKEKLLEIKKKRIEFKEAEKDHKRLTEKRDSYNSEHNSKLLSADSKQKLLLQNEVTEVEKISAPLKSKIASLKTQTQQLNREESDAVNQALQGFVKDYMSNKLSNHDLASVSIQGIGVELKRQLSAHGVKTFGDIIDVSVNYVQHGRFTNSIVQIQVKGRGNVKVPGIGLKKGETLLRYKKSLEQSYLSNAPKTPPSHVLDTIRKPFIIKRNKIDTDEQEAQKLLVQEVNRIHQSYAKQIEECSKEIIILKSGTEREFKELSWKAEQAEKLTQKKKAEIEQMEKGFKIYSPITFSSYIRRAFIA